MLLQLCPNLDSMCSAQTLKSSELIVKYTGLFARLFGFFVVLDNDDDDVCLFLEDDCV